MQDYGMRMYDARVGRFFSADPLMFEYPYYTPYQFAGNMPVSCSDLDGCEPAGQGRYSGQTVPWKGKTYVWTVYEAGGTSGHWVQQIWCTGHISRGNNNTGSTGFILVSHESEKAKSAAAAQQNPSASTGPIDPHPATMPRRDATSVAHVLSPQQQLQVSENLTESMADAQAPVVGKWWSLHDIGIGFDEHGGSFVSNTFGSAMNAIVNIIDGVINPATTLSSLQHQAYATIDGMLIESKMGTMGEDCKETFSNPDTYSSLLGNAIVAIGTSGFGGPEEFSTMNDRVFPGETEGLRPRKMTVIGRMEDLEQFDDNPNIDTWRKSGIQGPGIRWFEDELWLESKRARGDLFGIATNPETLPSVKNGYIPGTPNGYFTARELNWLVKREIPVHPMFK